MKSFYSPSNKLFYNNEFNYSNLPNDLIEITEEQYREYINAINLNSKELVLVDDTLTLVDKAPTPITWDDIRVKRNRLLSSSDFTQLPDVNLDKVAWATYRQTLRDIPTTYSNPSDVVWPTQPG